ncbi:MAG: diadenylate cyclase CdaA [Clostridia bacterium]|nr:diadenylate cyclase CdaA [Clostridia bacterium]
MPNWLTDFFASFSRNIKFSFVDIVDIICVAVLLYYVYKFIRDRRAGKLALGVAFIILFLILSDVLEMHALQYILKNVFQVGIITFVILFQPEFRSALEKMGGESLRGFRSISEQKGAPSAQVIIDAVTSAVTDMSAKRTGALIVFEGTTKLGDLILTGTVINADPSAFLIKNIFFDKSPLHDGAVIVRDGRLYAAGCLLPLSAKSDITQDLGTRHRAAIGMSENSDALVVVVSEETGIISVARDGVLKRGFKTQSLQRELKAYLVPETESQVGKAVSRLKRAKRTKKTSDQAGKEAKQKEDANEA